jgi:hypothetical protein
MKAVTIVTAAALLFGAHTAFAQTSSSSGENPSAPPSTAKQGSATQGSATHVRPHHMRRSGIAPRERSTTGSGIHERVMPGETGGSNPNPTWNKNPDSEVPGNTEE